MEKVLLQRTGEVTHIELPAYMSAHASGMDVRAAITASITLLPGARALVPCGFKMALPVGYEVQVRPRSGLAIQHGITCLNSPGTIDADYRGEVKVILINLGQEPFVINQGDRIAQMVLQRVPRLAVEEVQELSHSPRGEGGFGSTGY